MKARARMTAAFCALSACAPLHLHAATVPLVPVKVVLIGDSLSVGPFGRALEEALRARYGARELCVFASCGSSPEDWLPGRPVFVTNCGYRQTTPGGSFSREYQDGRRPPPVNTPKLPAILGYYQPQLVIVQLGTNWMDKLAASSKLDGRPYRKFIREFIRQLRRGPARDPAIVWVMPPASSQYPARVHEAVESWILEEAADLGFQTINSRSLTEPYREGKTGGDGVHYNVSAGQRWAKRVFSILGPAPERLPLAAPDAAR